MGQKMFFFFYKLGKFGRWSIKFRKAVNKHAIVFNLFWLWLYARIVRIPWKSLVIVYSVFSFILVFAALPISSLSSSSTFSRRHKLHTSNPRSLTARPNSPRNNELFSQITIFIIVAKGAENKTGKLLFHQISNCERLNWRIGKNVLGDPWSVILNALFFQWKLLFISHFF